MSRIRQRLGTVAALLLGLALLYMATDFARSAIAHKGAGYWTYGGDAGDGSMNWEPEHTEKISQAEYRRECWTTAWVLALAGGFITWAAVRSWTERDKLEASWTKFLADPINLARISQQPEGYRDDFVQWIKRNRPGMLPSDACGHHEHVQ